MTDADNLDMELIVPGITAFIKQDKPEVEMPMRTSDLSFGVINGDTASVFTCQCRIPGQDDGDTTCWLHHDCMLQECTHAEEDEQEFEED
jgi:hypothetical protein